MGIDGIGGGGIPPGGPKGPKGVAPSTGREFQVDPAAPEESVSGVASPQPLARLESGEITLDQYLDGQVDQAVSHLQDKLPAAQMTIVRETLREQLQTDPVLIELVKRATGQTPEPSP